MDAHSSFTALIEKPHQTDQPPVTFVRGAGHTVTLAECGPPPFSQKQRTWQLFRSQLWRVLLTCAFLATFAGTGLAYQAHGTIDTDGYRLCTAATTVVVLGLGLNFFEVFKDLGRVGRWRVLANREVDLREADLILGTPAVGNVLRLIVESRRPWIVAGSVAWLVLNLLAQMMVGVLPMQATLEGGFDSSGITVTPGPVSVPDLTCFYDEGTKECDDANHGYLSTAHAFGAGAQEPGPECEYDTYADIPSRPQRCPYLFQPRRREFVNRYVDWNPDDWTHASWRER